MGKGDIKTRRGKIRIGSFGVRRPRKRKNAVTTQSKPVAAPVKKKTAK